MTVGDTAWCSMALPPWSDLPGHGVYVVELWPEVLLDKMDRAQLFYEYPPLYVGQTSNSPEYRFVTHFSNHRLKPTKVATHGRFLRHDLFEHLPRVADQENARLLERIHAEQLTRLGFDCFTDGGLIDCHSLAPPNEEVEELRTENHVDQVGDAIDQIILQAVAAVKIRMPNTYRFSAEAAEHLLRARRPASIPSEIQIPTERRLAYLNPGALLPRIEWMIERGHLGGSRW